MCVLKMYSLETASKFFLIFSMATKLRMFFFNIVVMPVVFTQTSNQELKNIFLIITSYGNISGWKFYNNNIMRTRVIAHNIKNRFPLGIYFNFILCALLLAQQILQEPYSVYLYKNKQWKQTSKKVNRSTDNLHHNCAI